LKILTIEALTELCNFWQEKLGRSQWQIGLRICRAEDMSMRNVQATSEISLVTECALISILDSRDYPNTPFEQDMEVSLVHELLHIPLKYIAEPQDGTLENVHLEAFIERMARLLTKFANEKHSGSERGDFS